MTDMTSEQIDRLRTRHDEQDSLICDLAGLAGALEILAWDYAQESIKDTHGRMRRDGIVAISNAMGRLLGRDTDSLTTN